ALRSAAPPELYTGEKPAGVFANGEAYLAWQGPDAGDLRFVMLGEVSGAGAALPMPVAAAPSSRSVAVNRSGVAVVAYTRFDGNLGAERAFLRTLVLDRDGTACANRTACA